MFSNSSEETCDDSVMFRGKNKKLPEPSSEYSLNTLKSIDTNSTSFSGCDDSSTVAGNCDTNNSKNPNESSQLVPKHSGYE